MKERSRKKDKIVFTLDTIYHELRVIYQKYRRRYKGNTDSNQMCCMWSTHNPPDVLTGTEPIFDMEDTFGVDIDEDLALELYDIYLDEAARRIYDLMSSMEPPSFRLF